MAEFKGGCLCGAIRYQVRSDPIRQVNCHCDDCRKVTGSAFATNIFVNADDVEITRGTPKTFEHIADSGNVRVKAFCEICGSQLFGYGPNNTVIKSIKVGSIDDATFVEPTMNIYTSRALPCTHLSDKLENHEGPPGSS